MTPNDVILFLFFIIPKYHIFGFYIVLYVQKRKRTHKLCLTHNERDLA